MAAQEKATEATENAPVTIFTPATAIVEIDDETPTDVLPNNVVMRWCPHCLTETTQVGELPEKWPEEIPDEPKIVKTPGHCLQCIADGGDCCDLKAFSRWEDEDELELDRKETHQQA